LVTSSWLIGCGRVGFGDVDREPPGGLLDAPAAPDAPSAPDAPPPLDAAPTDSTLPAPTGPKLSVGSVPAMTTECGSTPATFAFELSNPGDMELTITKLPTDVDGFRLALRGGTLVLPLRIPAGGTVKIEVRPPDAVIGTDVGGSIKTAIAKIESNAVDQPLTEIELLATVMGANILVTVPAPPTTLAFSGSSGNCPQPRAATVRNTGNLSVGVQIRLPFEFAMAGTSTASLDENGVMTRNFRPFSSGACSGVGVIEYDVIGPSCAADLTTLNATFNITGASTCFCS
jgi:hypothetical protein